MRTATATVEADGRGLAVQVDPGTGEQLRRVLVPAGWSVGMAVELALASIAVRRPGGLPATC